MARKSAKNPSASASKSSSKRPAEETPSRQSKRARATARKSYAEPETDDEDEVPKKASARKASTRADDEDASEASGFDEASEDDPSSESVDDEESSADDVKPIKGTPRGRLTKKSLPMHKKHVDEKELWKPGAKLEPGTQIIIKKPQAREAGDTPYEDGTIHPNTMLFLKDLAANNDRSWLKSKLRSHVRSEVKVALELWYKHRRHRSSYEG